GAGGKGAACAGDARRAGGRRLCRSHRRQRASGLCRDRLAAGLRRPCQTRRRRPPPVQRRTILLFAGFSPEPVPGRQAMTILPSVSPPLPTPDKWARSLNPADPFKWLAQGWRDFMTMPVMSIAYGLLILVISIGFVGGLIALGRDYILFPAFAGFMVVGPILAVGLYEKSRRIEEGLPLSWSNL